MVFGLNYLLYVFIFNQGDKKLYIEYTYQKFKLV